MNPVRVGVIGRGFGARVHAPAFGTLPGVEVVGIAGSENWRDIIDNPEIDVVTVATPPATHRSLVCVALGAGKHVLCEKPFGMNAAEARTMCEAVQAKGTVTGIGFQFRMEDGIALLKEELRSGRIGTLERINVEWLFDSKPAAQSSWKTDVQAGGGVINTLASHVVDYLEWISGRSIINVRARSETVCEIEAEMTGGVVVSVKASNSFSPSFGHRIEMQGDQGRVAFFHASPFDGVPSEVRLEPVGQPSRMKTFPSPAGSDSRIATFQRLASTFIQAVLGDVAPDLPSFASGFRVRTVLDAIVESAYSGASVKVPAS